MQDQNNIDARFREITSALQDPEAQAALKELKRVAPTVLISAYLLTKARRARKRGNLLNALFYAILWHGFTNNSNSAEILRVLKGTR